MPWGVAPTYSPEKEDMTVAKETAVLEPEVEKVARKIYCCEGPTVTLVIDPPSDAFTDKHTLKATPANRGYVLKFADSVAMCAPEYVGRVLKSPGYKVEYAFADELEASQDEAWVKNFVRRADLKREICNLKPLLTGKTTAKF